MAKLQHEPVLVKEIISSFNPSGTDRLLDGTLGLGGHTAAYLTAGGDKVTAVGIEADEKALAEAKENLASFQERVKFVHGNYYAIKDSIPGGGILYPPLFNHILLDLGIGSHQLSDASRGFSFRVGTTLTMKYGPATKLPSADIEALNTLTSDLNQYPDASDMVARLNAEDLAKIIRHYGEERYAYRIAKAIEAEHGKAATMSAQELATVIRKALPTSYEHGRIDPATRTFQAFRLAVNRELEALRAVLPQLVEMLAPEGKIAVIAFHSLEDRIVKTFFRQEEKGCICPPEQPTCTCGKKPRLTLLNRRPIIASPDEVTANPRARSAKLRIAQRIGGSG